MQSGHAENIIEIYRRVAREFDRDRGKALIERPYLDAVISQTAERAEILDLGCGCGEPIAKYFIEGGHSVTGVDSSPAMLEMCRERFPSQTWIEGDMRNLELARTFDAVIAWDSFFHLTEEDQRQMMPRFASWCRPGGALLFTSGPRSGEVIGEMYGYSLYHASLSPEEYTSLLSTHGFEVISYTPEDQNCGGHSVWLARRLN